MGATMALIPFFLNAQHEGVAMTSMIFTWRLTKHGRARFIERLGMMKDNEMILKAILGHEDYTFVWAPDQKYPVTGRRLVTVLYKKRRKVW